MNPYAPSQLPVVPADDGEVPFRLRHHLVTAALQLFSGIVTGIALYVASLCGAALVFNSGAQADYDALAMVAIVAFPPSIAVPLVLYGLLRNSQRLWAWLLLSPVVAVALASGCGFFAWFYA